MGPVELWTHPETVLRLVATNGARFVFLGDPVSERDPSLGDPFAPERIAEALAGGDAALYDFLDTFAGRFALFVIQGARLRVFHDPMGARSVFYHDQAPLALSSHAMLLAHAVEATKGPDIRALRDWPGFLTRKTRCLPGDLTLYLGVYALTPNNLFDSSSLGTRRYWPRAPRAETSPAAFERQLDTTIEALCRYVAASHTPIIGATAGADARVLLAGFRRFGVDFETVTWTPSKLSQVERDIIAELVQRIDARHVESRPVPDKSLRPLIRNNSGGYRKADDTSLEMRALYGGRRDAIFIRGYGAEIIRGFFNLWPTRATALTPAEMARLYDSPKPRPLPPGLVQMFEGYFRRANYEGVASFGFDPNDIFYWEHRMGMWGAGVINEFDVVSPSLSGFNSRPLFLAALGLPAETRLSKRLFVDAANRLEPRLRGLPLDKMVEAPEARRANGKAGGTSTRPSTGKRGQPRSLWARARRRLRALFGLSPRSR